MKYTLYYKAASDNQMHEMVYQGDIGGVERLVGHLERGGDEVQTIKSDDGREFHKIRIGKEEQK